MSEKTSIKETHIFVVLILLAVATRVLRINQGFWYDELYTILNYIHAPLSQMLTSMPRPNNHVLSNLLIRLSFGIFGEAEWSARLPSLILGSLTVPILYIMGRRFFSVRVSFLASLLLCFSKWPVWFSQEARGYAGMILCVLASQMLFLELIEKFRTRRAWLYFFVSLAAIYFHLYSAFIIASQVLVFLVFRIWRQPEAGWKPFYATMTVMLAALVIYTPMLSSMMEFLDTGARVTSGRGLSSAFFIQLIEEWGYGKGHLLLSLVMAAFFLIGLIESSFKRPVVSAAFILSILLIFLVTWVMGLFIYHRFLAFFIPFYFLLIACGVEALSRWIKIKRPAFAIMTALLLVIVLPALVQYYSLGMQGFRQAAELIENDLLEFRVYSIGLSAEEFRYYKPDAIPVPMGRNLDVPPDDRFVVVGSHPWSWGNFNSSYISNNCLLGAAWPSAGYEENEVSLFICEAPPDTSRKRK